MIPLMVNEVADQQQIVLKYCMLEVLQSLLTVNKNRQ